MKMSAFDQLKEMIENHSDIITKNLSEDDLEQLNAFLNRISSNAEKLGETIAENLPEENRENLKKKAKNVSTEN